MRGHRSLSHAVSPLLAAPAPLWRSRFLVALVGLGFAGLLGRALYVQGIGQSFFKKQGEARHVHTMELPASRGRLVDRQGQVLASSVVVPSIWAMPADVEADPARRRALAAALGLAPAELDRKLASTARFVWLRRQVGEDVAARVKALDLKGVHQDSEYQRRYPEGEAVAHVVGFTDMDEHGQEGMELAFQSALQGREGSRAVLRDRLGRVVEDLRERVPAVNGQDIDLSIDATLQHYAYQRLRQAVTEHQAKAGSVVVIDAQTGEVLTLANYPSYQPGDRSRRSGEQLRNRALTDQFEPGSTIKPFIAAQAIETGRVRTDTRLDTTPGALVIGGKTIRDTHGGTSMTVGEVIQKSSNIGTVRMAMQMPPAEMHGLYRHLGLGQRPQLEFPGAATGSLRPAARWKPVEQATMAYGYGLSASLLQLAQAYTVFARDGERIPLRMTRLADAAPVQGERVFSPQTARAVREMLRTVTETGGTSVRAQVAGYSVGGKSGTAYKQEGRGYATDKYRAWFVGLAPVSAPRVVVAVMVDEPRVGFHDGGKVAGPVFSEVAAHSLRLLRVPADLDVRPEILACALATRPQAC